MPDDTKASEQDEEQQLFAEQGKETGAEAAPVSKPAVEAGTGAPDAQAEGPDRGAIAAEILADKELDPEDFARAQRDQEFLSSLVDARIEEQKEKASATKTDGEKPAVEDAGKRKPRRGYQRKIDRLHERVLELEAELGGRREVEQPPAPAQPPQGKRMPAPETAKPEPKEDQFQGFEEFEKAHRSWEIETTANRIFESRTSEERQRAQAARNEMQRQQAETNRATLAQKAFEDGRAAHEDFDYVIGEAGDVVITDPMDYAILRAENPGEILYLLANKPEEAQRIAGLPDADVFLEIGRLDARLGNAQPEKANGAGGTGRPTEKPPEVSKAPPPPKLVGGSGRSGKTMEYYAKTASPEEFRKAVLGKEI